MLKISLDVQKRLAESRFHLNVLGISSYFVNEEKRQDISQNSSISQKSSILQNPSKVRCKQIYDLRKIMKTHGRIFSLESHMKDGGLADFITRIREVSPVRIGAKGLAGSSLLLEEILSFHQISVPHIMETIKTETATETAK
jgi:hypothetical protein